jgi:hypothetical protein
MGAASLAVPEQRVFRIFISYASEDKAIAAAVASCFKAALPDFFAEVEIDSEFLEAGKAFQPQLEEKLQKADRLIIVYTAAEKPSHGYTGWEVGFFDHIMRTDPGRRKKISLYLYGPPPTTAFEQGISLGLSKAELQMNSQQFEAQLAVSPEEPLCKEIEDWQNEVGRNIEKTGFARPHWRPAQEPANCVRNLKSAIFQCLKGTVENEVKPQKQITIRAKGFELAQCSENLPPGAEVRPRGALDKGGSMTIFGLSDEPISWRRFLDLTASQASADSWRDAITSVVLSAFPDRVDVDNGQVILASDGKTGYRIILTTATKYYDDDCEYNLYFVETLRRPDYGDQDTTYLLKGLELVCRFRSAFLESNSDFLGKNVGVTDILKVPEVARNLLKELNFLHKDAQDARLDRPGMWTKWVNFDHIKKISEVYRPSESKLRAIISKISAAKGNPPLLEPLRNEMAEVLMNMENALRPENALLLREMSLELNHIVERQDKVDAGQVSDK